MEAPEGYRLIDGQYYKIGDRSGPYAIDSAGNATLMGSATINGDVNIDSTAIANGAATAPSSAPQAGSELDLIGKLLAAASISSASIISLQTAATGTNWATFADTPGRMIDIQNNTGADIEYRRGGSGPSMRIPDGTGRSTWLLANADEISIRRVDTSNTQVTVSAEVAG